MMRILVAGAFAALPEYGMAQGLAPTSYEPFFHACLASDPPETCAGRTAEACMAVEIGGQSTLGMSNCLAMEATLWSQEISREVTRRTHMLRGQDAENRRFFDEAYSGAAEALAVSQATWEAWSAAECSLTYAEWGSGSFRHVAAGNCRVRLSAERLARLRQIGEDPGQ